MLVLWLLPGLADAASLAAGGEPRLEHDPFAWPPALRAPAPAKTGASAAEPSAEVWQPRLRAVVVAGSRSMVNVGGSIVSLGEQFEGYRLVGVEENKATFSKNGLRVELKMDGGNAATR